MLLQNERIGGAGVPVGFEARGFLPWQLHVDGHSGRLSDRSRRMNTDGRGCARDEGLTALMPSSASTDNGASDHRLTPADADCLSGRLLDRRGSSDRIRSSVGSRHDADQWESASERRLAWESDRRGAGCLLGAVERALAARRSQFRQAAGDDRDMCRYDRQGSRADRSEKHNHDRYRSFRARAGRDARFIGCGARARRFWQRALRVQRAPTLPDQTHRVRTGDAAADHENVDPASSPGRPRIRGAAVARYG